jgi:hypothetical protein
VVRSVQFFVPAPFRVERGVINFDLRNGRLAQW